MRQNQWRKFDRVFSDGSHQQRYIREIIFGKRREVQYWQITNDPETLPKNSTWYVMTKVPSVKYKFFNLIKPWLKVFPIPHLSMGFERLIGLMNLLRGAVPTTVSEPGFLFSSA